MIPKIRKNEVLIREGLTIWAIGLITNIGGSFILPKLDPKIVIPMPVGDVDGALSTFLHEMGVTTPPEPVSKLAVTISTLPQEVTTILLESRSKS